MICGGQVVDLAPFMSLLGLAGRSVVKTGL